MKAPRQILSSLLILSLALPSFGHAGEKGRPDLSATVRQRTEKGWKRLLHGNPTTSSLHRRMEEKASSFSATLPWHVGQTFLMIGAIGALATIEEVRKQERLEGKSFHMSDAELAKLAASAVANDPTIWAGFSSAMITERALQGPVESINRTLTTVAGRTVLAGVLQSAVGTTVAFFGWELGKTLLRMAIRLDEADLTAPGGRPTPLTESEIVRAETRFLEIFALPVLAAAHGINPSGTLRKDRGPLLVQGANDLLLIQKIARNLSYILFIHDELRSLWFDMTIRLGFATGETLLFAAIMTASGLIGGAVGNALQPVIPIPGMQLVVGFLFAVGGGTSPTECPPK
jgi:hypothetical protein